MASRDVTLKSYATLRRFDC